MGLNASRWPNHIPKSPREVICSISQSIVIGFEVRDANLTGYVDFFLYYIIFRRAGHSQSAHERKVGHEVTKVIDPSLLMQDTTENCNAESTAAIHGST